MPTPDLHFVLTNVVYLCMLGAIGLILFVPFFPGLAVVLAGILLYVGYASYEAHAFAGAQPIALAVMVLLAVAGLTSSWWQERLGLRFSYMAQSVMWGALLGSFIGLFVAGIFGMLLGLIAGTFVMELRSGRAAPEALRLGLGSLLSLLGPRGLQLLLTLLVTSLALRTLAGLGAAPVRSLIGM